MLILVCDLIGEILFVPVTTVTWRESNRNITFYSCHLNRSQSNGDSCFCDKCESVDIRYFGEISSSFLLCLYDKSEGKSPKQGTESTLKLDRVITLLDSIQNVKKHICYKYTLILNSAEVRFPYTAQASAKTNKSIIRTNTTPPNFLE